MVHKGETSVLRRKTAEREARGMSPRRALRLVLARLSETVFGQPVIVSAISRWRADQQALLARVEGSPMMTTIRNDAGQTGAVILDLQLVSALVEAQTIGTILRRPAVDRLTTRTDAAICLPLIDDMLSGFEAEMLAQVDLWPSGFRFAEWLGEKRAMDLALTALDYDVFRVEFELGQEGRSGILLLALPIAEAPAEPVPEKRPVASLKPAVLAAQARLTVILHRQQMTLKEVSALAVGTRLNIPIAALDRAHLCLPDGGQILAEGRLGQRGGRWGLQVNHLNDGACITGPLDALPHRTSDPAAAADPIDKAMPSAGTGLPEPVEPTAGIPNSQAPPEKVSKRVGNQG